MKPLQPSKTTSLPNRLIISWSRPTSTDAMPPNAPFALQKPLHRRPLQHGQRLPSSSLGSPATTDRAHAQSAARVPHQPTLIRLGTTPWPLRFQPHTHCPAGHPRHHPRKARCSPNLGPSRDRRLVPWACPAFVPMLHGLGNGHAGPTHHRHFDMAPLQDSHANHLVP